MVVLIVGEDDVSFGFFMMFLVFGMFRFVSSNNNNDGTLLVLGGEFFPIPIRRRCIVLESCVLICITVRSFRTIVSFVSFVLTEQ